MRKEREAGQKNKKQQVLPASAHPAWPNPGRPYCVSGTMVKRRASEGTSTWVHVLALMSYDLRQVL